MPLTIPTSIGQYAAQIQSYILKGVGADRIYRLLREQSRIPTGKPADISRNEIRNYSRSFRGEAAIKQSFLPTQKSKRFLVEHSIQTDLKSPLGYRYLLDFTFKLTNPETGAIKHLTNTIGFNRLDRMGVFYRDAQERLMQFNDLPPEVQEKYQIEEGFIADLGSVEFTSLLRTRNR